VAVRRFDTPDYIRQGRIVYRETPEEIGFYDYHRWAADPGTTITTAMMDALRSSPPFSLVVPYDGREQQECVLSGRVERLDEVDYGGGVRVEARILAELVNQRTGETLWTGDASDTAKIETRTVGSVVDAMSHAVTTSIGRLVASMEQASPRGLRLANGGPDIESARDFRHQADRRGPNGVSGLQRRNDVTHRETTGGAPWTR
jgi:uncharacterized lipoprotein YmbA